VNESCKSYYRYILQSNKKNEVEEAGINRNTFNTNEFGDGRKLIEAEEEE
jgi:hypothetical protein